MKMLLLAMFIPLYLVSFNDAHKSYEGYKVVRVVPRTVAQLKSVQNLNSQLNVTLDYWKDAMSVGRFVDIMAAPRVAEKLIDTLAGYGLESKIAVKNVGRLIQRSEMGFKQDIRWDFNDPRQFPLNQYHSHKDMMQYLQAVSKYYSKFVMLGSLGNSHEGREMLYVKIGTPPAANQIKNAVFLDAGIHAREWIAPATALYIINQLVSNYNVKRRLEGIDIRTILDSVDVYIAPSINPDGYEYSRTVDRLWRKTRSGPRRNCYGVDPNRNFPFMYGVAGTSSNPCSDAYNGPSPFSEIEARNLHSFLDANKKTINAYLTLHSYGEDLLYPWGYAKNTYPTDVEELREVGLQAAEAIRAVHGTRYTVGNSADSLYPVGGASDDYAKSLGIKFVYTVELPPGNSPFPQGFLLPENQILPTAAEFFEGFMVVAKRVRRMKIGPF